MSEEDDSTIPSLQGTDQELSDEEKEQHSKSPGAGGGVGDTSAPEGDTSPAKGAPSVSGEDQENRQTES